MTTKVNESQIYAVVPGIDGSWGVVNEVDFTIATSKVRDGGAPEETTYGRKSYGDLVLERPYDSARDPAMVKYLRALPVGKAYNPQIHTCDPAGTVISTDTYRGGLKGVRTPKGDAMSDTPTSVQITLSIDGSA